MKKNRKNVGERLRIAMDELGWNNKSEEVRKRVDAARKRESPRTWKKLAHSTFVRVLNSGDGRTFPEIKAVVKSEFENRGLPVPDLAIRVDQAGEYPDARQAGPKTKRAKAKTDECANALPKFQSEDLSPKEPAKVLDDSTSCQWGQKWGPFLSDFVPLQKRQSLKDTVADPDLPKTFECAFIGLKERGNTSESLKEIKRLASEPEFSCWPKVESAKMSRLWYDKFLEQQMAIQKFVQNQLELGEELDWKAGVEGFLWEEERPSRHRILTTFLLFLTKKREKIWTCLPLGHQRCLGFALHEDNPLYKEWLHLRGKKRGPLSLHDDTDFTVHLNHSKNWILETINRTARMNGYIFYSALYSLLPDMLSQLLSPNNLTVQRLFDLRSRNIERANFSKLFSTKDPDSLGTKSVFLFEPGGRYFFEDLAKDGPYKFVFANHGLDIPCGIGITHLMIPSLLVEEKFKKLTEIAVQVYSKVSEELRLIGIDFNP